MAGFDPTPHPLDRPPARIVAVLVAAASLGLLGYIERDRLLPRPQPAAARLPVALAKCLDERVGAVERMAAEGVANPAQITLFRQRAEDYCRAQFPK